MPFVRDADAANASHVRVAFDPGAGDTDFIRHRLLASPTLRLLQLGFEAGFATIPHYHPGAGEFFYVLWGSGRFIIGDEDLAPEPGDLLYAAPGVVHQIVAGDHGLRILAGVSPNEDRSDEEVQAPEASGVDR